MRLLLVLFLTPLLTYAGTEDRLDCSDFFGLNVCSTSLTDEDKNQLKKENVFRNNDSFRVYMKTIGPTNSPDTSEEFSVKKRILDTTNFGLDCRMVASSIYEISGSNYYDCAVQRYF